MSEFREALTSGDKQAAYRALLEDIADKLDAGICMHCGGPRGEAAGMASLARQAMKILEVLEIGSADDEQVSAREQIAKERAERRRRAAAQNPKEARVYYREFGSGSR